MTLTPRLLVSAVLGFLLAAAFAGLAPAYAQKAEPDPPSTTGVVTDRLDSFKRDTGNFFGHILGRDDAAPEQVPVVQAQMSASDLVVRLDRLENTIRQLTGTIEQLQYRNQQLEQQLKRMQDDVEFRFQEMGKGGGRLPPARTQAPPSQQPVQPLQPAPPPPAAAPPQRRSEVYDPAQDPNAVGSPRTLGTMPADPSSGPPPVVSADSDDVTAAPPVGAPGGRQAGAPLDLSTLSAQVSQDPSLGPPPGPQANAGNGLPPPPPRNPSATGGQPQAMLPPTATPKDEYDLAYGYLLRKDYALSEDSFRAFLRKYPSDRLTGEANYWLGESLFQRQRYRDAAEIFLTVSTKYDKSGKAPEALLRLGQSLAALNEKESACATFGEIMRKYPRASAGVKQGIEREQKRVHC
jgi:tol-pal system protein YbgF